jgi:hypothetical protein
MLAAEVVETIIIPMVLHMPLVVQVEVVEADYREVVQSQEQLILAVEAEVLETLIVMVQQVVQA